jgi:hypothetical protein
MRSQVQHSTLCIALCEMVGRKLINVAANALSTLQASCVVDGVFFSI